MLTVLKTGRRATPASGARISPFRAPAHEDRRSKLELAGRREASSFIAGPDVVAAWLVVVDAIDDRAAAFYRGWGFIDVPENPRRLFRKIGDIRRSLETDAAG